MTELGNRATVDTVPREEAGTVPEGRLHGVPGEMSPEDEAEIGVLVTSPGKSKTASKLLDTKSQEADPFLMAPKGGDNLVTSKTVKWCSATHKVCGSLLPVSAHTDLDYNFRLFSYF